VSAARRTVCIASTMDSMISSSFRKWMYCLVGWTLTSTVSGFSCRLR
jgi:hypothetical protein